MPRKPPQKLSKVVGTRLYVPREYALYTSNVKRSGLRAADYNRASLLQGLPPAAESKPRQSNFPKDQRQRVRTSRGATLARRYEPASKFLAMLGQTRAFDDLHAISRAVEAGTLMVTPEINSALVKACNAMIFLAEEVKKDVQVDEDE